MRVAIMAKMAIDIAKGCFQSGDWNGEQLYYRWRDAAKNLHYKESELPLLCILIIISLAECREWCEIAVIIGFKELISYLL